MKLINCYQGTDTENWKNQFKQIFKNSEFEKELKKSKKLKKDMKKPMKLWKLKNWKIFASTENTRKTDET
jgi:hypothetical protein